MDALTLTPYRIAHVVGARPQFVKLKPLVEAISRAGGRNWVAHTGQHYDAAMNDSFWAELGFRPDYQGAWVERTADAAALTLALGRAAVDAVVVYGDTDSTVLGAKAALELGLPCAHAEAGLRSFNALMPEEHNRLWVDQRAHWLWAPTASAQEQLEREGLDRGAPWTVVTGDLMRDAFPSAPNATTRPGRILVTVHRNTNVDVPERLRRIEAAMDALAEDFEVVWPRHPRHRAAGSRSVRVPDCPPLSREDLVNALFAAEWVVTDSGGLQKEAFFAGKRCVVLRGETEWTELVEHGWAALVDPDTPDLAGSVKHLFAQWQAHPLLAPPQLYGDGRAAEKMVQSLAQGLAEQIL
ncbi:MAG: UDP-2,3-diacetamido-2,3-dideoxy-D-glucuronate 2-epimerase [Bacteroidota bacterium]